MLFIGVGGVDRDRAFPEEVDVGHFGFEPGSYRCARDQLDAFFQLTADSLSQGEGGQPAAIYYGLYEGVYGVLADLHLDR